MPVLRPQAPSFQGFWANKKSGQGISGRQLLHSPALLMMSLLLTSRNIHWSEMSGRHPQHQLPGALPQRGGAVTCPKPWNLAVVKVRMTLSYRVLVNFVAGRPKAGCSTSLCLIFLIYLFLEILVFTFCIRCIHSLERVS